MTYSEANEDRVSARRQGVIDELVGHAADVVAESGAGALTVSEVARRTGMRPPSVYKYFPSLHALYDAVFERPGQAVAVLLREQEGPRGEEQPELGPCPHLECEQRQRRGPRHLAAHTTDARHCA